MVELSLAVLSIAAPSLAIQLGSVELHDSILLKPFGPSSLGGGLLNIHKFNQIPKIKFAVKFISPIARFVSA